MDVIPCPDRIIDDCGGAFIMGAVGSGIWNFFKGYRNTPKRASGWLRSRSKLHGAAQAIRQHAPRTGGAFAVWGFTFSIFDCLISKQRRKEDPFNSILSGALTGGVLSIKRASFLFLAIFIFEFFEDFFYYVFLFLLGRFWCFLTSVCWDISLKLIFVTKFYC